jgi:hypothetical protein
LPAKRHFNAIRSVFPQVLIPADAVNHFSKPVAKKTADGIGSVPSTDTERVTRLVPRIIAHDNVAARFKTFYDEFHTRREYASARPNVAQGDSDLLCGAVRTRELGAGAFHLP